LRAYLTAAPSSSQAPTMLTLCSSVCASLCIGAPLRLDAADAPRPSAKRYLCVLCQRDLAKVKHHRPYGDGRACKKHSIAEKPSPAASPSAPSAPLRSHKRKAASDPGEFAPFPLPLHPQPTLPDTEEQRYPHGVKD
jgi:hypothetical protein